MSLIKFIIRSVGSRLWLPVAAGLFSGICSSALIAYINYSLNTSKGNLSAPLVWYALLCLLLLTSTFLSQILLVRLSQRSMLDLRMRLTRKILNAPLRKLEETGSGALISILANDTTTIGNALNNVPVLCINLATMLAALLYIGWLSTTVLSALLIFLMLGAISHWLIAARAGDQQKASRKKLETLMGHFEALLHGNKELKLNYSRREDFYHKDLLACAVELRRLNFSTYSIFIAAEGWSRLVYFIFIGFLLFTLPAIVPLSPSVLTGYVLVTLFLMGPIATIANALPVFRNAQTCLQRLDELGITLVPERKEAGLFNPPESAPNWDCLELFDVTHTYHSEKEDRAFTLGPIDLKFVAGELVFLIGGNGSGKSTLAKIITGLYVPESGSIKLDDVEIKPERMDNYRQLFSAVFSDFFLFERLPGEQANGFHARSQRYLFELQLGHKVAVEDGKLTSTALSSGQRKRLALLAAYLEDRSFYVFDEWASDQDPLFKKVFYLEILPELKSRGKTVLVITHDDRYFSVADRIIKLDYGQLADDPQAQTREVERLVAKSP